MHNNIPIFLSSDNNYAPFVATTIASICDNTESFCEFYILDGGITKENQEKIYELKNLFSNFSIEFIKINLENFFKDFKVNMHFSKSMYSRFLIPILKPEWDKILYTDVDVIVLDDIKKMYNEDLEGFALAAVWEEFGHNSLNSMRNAKIGLKKDNKYFSSGNLILDCKIWRTNDISYKLLHIGEELKDLISAPDQDILNKYFADNYKILPAKYCYKNTDYNFYKTHNDIVIRHYNGPIKPWQISPELEEDVNIGFMYLKNKFWEYAKITPFYDIIKEKIIYNTKSDMNKFRVTELLRKTGKK